MSAAGGSPEASEAPEYRFEAFLAHNSEDKGLVGTVLHAVLDRVPDARSSGTTSSRSSTEGW